MGVQIYLLENQATSVKIETKKIRMGIAKSLCKVTEMNAWRDRQINDVKLDFENRKTPPLVMLVDGIDFEHAIGRRLVRVNTVLGWPPGRVKVTDGYYDHFPVFGYAFYDSIEFSYVLHELRENVLFPMSKARAAELRVLDNAGRTRTTSEPTIISCWESNHLPAVT